MVGRLVGVVEKQIWHLDAALFSCRLGGGESEMVGRLVGVVEEQVWHLDAALFNGNLA